MSVSTAETRSSRYGIAAEYGCLRRLRSAGGDLDAPPSRVATRYVGSCRRQDRDVHGLTPRISGLMFLTPRGIRRTPQALSGRKISFWHRKVSPRPLCVDGIPTDGQLMAILCGSTRTRTGRPCRRRRNSPCKDHRGMALPRSGRGRPGSSGTTTPFGTVDEAIIKIAVEATTDDWRSAIAEQGSELLGKRLWGEVRVSKRPDCAPLAVAARRLLEAKEQAHQLLADLLEGRPPADLTGR